MITNLDTLRKAIEATYEASVLAYSAGFPKESSSLEEIHERLEKSLKLLEEVADGEER